MRQQIAYRPRCLQPRINPAPQKHPVVAIVRLPDLAVGAEDAEALGLRVSTVGHELRAIILNNIIIATDCELGITYPRHINLLVLVILDHDGGRCAAQKDVEILLFLIPIFNHLLLELRADEDDAVLTLRITALILLLIQRSLILFAVFALLLSLLPQPSAPLPHLGGRACLRPTATTTLPTPIIDPVFPHLVAVLELLIEDVVLLIILLINLLLLQLQLITVLATATTLLILIRVL